MQPDDLVSLHRNAADANTTALAGELREAIAGDVRFDRGERAMYGHDSSNYRHPALGVVHPRTLADVEITVQLCRKRGVPLLSRGGGTSLAGQSCNEAVMIEFTRYLDAILSIDPARRVARVQPGVILDQLRDAAAPHGLTFGPDPATHTHCTLGGMLGNNACGIHAVLSEFYGPGARTADQVRRLEILTYDGVRMSVGPTTDEDYQQIQAEGGRRAEIYRRLRELVDRNADRIRAEFPDIPRRVSGYNLPALLPENGFDLGQALIGSESSCVTILEAEVTLCPSFPERALVVLGYPSVYTAGDHIPRIREFRPVGCEGLDDRLIELGEAKHMNPGGVKLLPDGAGWLLVEFGADNREEARARARDMMAALARERPAPTMRLFESASEMSELWEVRESGLGATAFVPGRADTWPGWEDSAVPPDRVGVYLRELRTLFDEYGYEAALYGHFAQGCIHCRIDFDLRSDEGIDRYRRFTQAAAELVVSHGGSLSGEHGDGQARGDLLPIMYGPEIMTAFHAFKDIWDPDHAMNPGRVIDAAPRTEDLKVAMYRPFAHVPEFAYPEDGGDFAHAAMRCVGVGKCRRNGGGVMCPSYMVTHEEKHCTRGRSRLLYEMLQADVIEDGWQSQEVFEALDLCLACKGCKSDCPVNVDMATYKAEFMSQYYKGTRRPLQAYAFGWIHRWARLGAMVPWLTNFATQTPGLRRLAAWIAGMAPARQIPRFAPRTFQRRFLRGERQSPSRDPKAKNPVILWPDTFNNHFYPDTLMAMVSVLEDAGFAVIVPQDRLCCGRALYDYGMLDTGRDLWRKTLDALGSAIDGGVPLVGAEPSCVAAFRDELPNLFPNDGRAQKLSQQTYTLGELLGGLGDGYQPPLVHERAILQPHCHHRSVMQFDADQQLIEKMGLELAAEPSGCCGMAGAFGFERDKYDVSLAIGELELLPAVRAAGPETLIIADGFSCREQIRQGTERQAVHVAEVIERALLARAVAERARRLHSSPAPRPQLYPPQPSP